MIHQLLAHVIGSDGKGLWTWTWSPSILIGLAAWTLGYVILVILLGKPSKWQKKVSFNKQTLFHLGTLVVFIALVSPLDHLSDEYLLSAHMVQHMLLLLVAPPLWLLGMPADWLDDFIPAGDISKFIYSITRPIPALIIFNCVLWLWHIPTLYDAALADENIHILEHLMFIAAGILGWWPVLGFLPKTAPRPAYPLQMVFIFAGMVFATALGILLTLSQSLVYPFYLETPLINGSRLWGLSAMQDQQIAGLIMWAPGNLIYFSAFMLTIRRWMRAEEGHEVNST
jgi:putative membrane protein